MSVEAMNWALAQKTGSPPAKVVLIVLANRAHPSTGECFPGIDGIAEQTELSRRAVINQIAKLEAAGLLSTVRRGGDGSGRKSNVYRLHIGQSADGAHRGNVHVEHGAHQAGQCAPGAGQCAPGAPEYKDNPKKKPKSRRATRIPDDFELTQERRLVAEAERLPAERTFAKFRDYWTAVSGAKARKIDWDATWRNWCRNESDRFGGHPQRAKDEFVC